MKISEGIRRAFKNKQILIFSDSQAALKALSGSKVTSRLVVECQDALLVLENHNEVTLMWVPGHQGILGNEEADKLARQRSAAPLLSTEPALGTPTCLASEAIMNWIELQHFTTWTHKPGCKHGKLFIGKPCKKRADDLLKQDRYQLKLIAGILTGHAPVRSHLQTIGLYDGDPSCRFCGLETETVQHLVCYCEALSRKHFNAFGELTIEPNVISTATVRDLCLFIRNTGISKLCSIVIRGCTISHGLRCFWSEIGQPLL